jgi:hypothetical protein
MPIAESTVRNDPRRRRFFPFVLQRFRGLRGGMTGDVTVLARSRKLMEIQLGDDWVQLHRDDAIALMCAVHAFLAFDDEFHDRILKLEMSPEERARLEELIAAYKRSDEGQSDARDARDAAAEIAAEEADAVVDEPAPRRPRRRHN